MRDCLGPRKRHRIDAAARFEALHGTLSGGRLFPRGVEDLKRSYENGK